LELPLGFLLDVVHHLLIAVRLHLLGEVEALVDREHDPHALGYGSFRGLDLGVDAAEVDCEKELVAKRVGVGLEWSGEALAARGFDADGVYAGISKRFDRVFDGLAIEIVEYTAGNRLLGFRSQH